MISSATRCALSALLAGVLTTSVTVAQTTDAGLAKLDKSVYAELAKVPPKAATRRNPLESDPDAVAAGAKLFDHHCAECHGANADGAKKGPSLRTEELQRATPGALFWVLTNGVVRKGMPVWSKLPEPQRWQLVTYIKSINLPQKPAN